MRKILAAVLALAAAAPLPIAQSAQAQTVAATVVAVCGTPPVTYAAGQNRPVTQDVNGKLCDQGGGAVSANSTIVAPLGSQLSAASVSVVVASDQAAVAVKQATAANLNATVVGTGTFGTQTTLQAGSAIAGKFGIDQTTPGTTNGVQTLSGSVSNVTLQAGSALAGKFGIDQTTPGITNGIVLNPITSGGLSVFSAIVAANNTSVAVKASAGQLFGITGYSIAATAPLFVKTYDAAQGSTTCGAGTPKERHMIPAAGGAPGSGAINGAPAVYGTAYATAITYCAVTGIADNDSTAPGASSYLLDFYFK